VDDQTHFKISNGVENNTINKKENKILCDYKISNNEDEIINKRVREKGPNKEKNENKLLRGNKNLNKNLSIREKGFHFHTFPEILNPKIFGEGYFQTSPETLNTRMTKDALPSPLVNSTPADCEKGNVQASLRNTPSKGVKKKKFHGLTGENKTFQS